MDSWRKPSPHHSMWASRLEPFAPATRIFDQVAYIGNPYVSCFVIETSEGLFMIDAMLPGEHFEQGLEEGFAALGYRFEQLKAVLITHGHFDHYGCADFLRKKSGCRVYMSKIDYDAARINYDNGPGGKLPWEIEDFLTDGGIFQMGDTEVRCVLTPGHTIGCMSFIFNVTDEGRPHRVALWGGTGLPRGLPEKKAYLESTEKFAGLTAALNVDVELSNHPFIDSGLERVQLLRSMHDGVPNPFVLGKENYKYYESMFSRMCTDALKKQAAEEADAK